MLKFEMTISHCRQFLGSHCISHLNAYNECCLGYNGTATALPTSQGKRCTSQMLCQGPAQVFGATVRQARMRMWWWRQYRQGLRNIWRSWMPQLTSHSHHQDWHDWNMRRRQDKALQALAEVIKVGWPADKRDIALDVRAYHNVRDELTVENGIIFRGQRCVVPSSHAVGSRWKAPYCPHGHWCVPT